jgi:ParB/RepB/Spo0J family partition protein
MGAATDAVKRLSEQKEKAAEKPNGKAGDRSGSVGAGLTVDRGRIEVIKLDDIDVDSKFNARGPIDVREKDFLLFVSDIRERGLLENLEVRTLEKPTKSGKRYSLVAGFMRHCACKLAGLTEVHCLVKDIGECDAMLDNLAENEHRWKLRAYELACRCALLKKEYDLTGDQIGHKLHKSKSHVNNLIRCIEKLPAPILDAFKRHDDAASTIDYIQISGLNSKEEMMAAWRQMFGKSAGEPGVPLDKPARGEKPLRVKSRDKIRILIHDLRRADDIFLESDWASLTDRDREVARQVCRWIIGEVQRYPVKLPPEDAG